MKNSNFEIKVQTNVLNVFADLKSLILIWFVRAVLKNIISFVQFLVLKFLSLTFPLLSIYDCIKKHLLRKLVKNANNFKTSKFKKKCKVVFV